MLPFALLAATVASCVSTSGSVELRIGLEPVSCALDLAAGETVELTIEQGDRDLQVRVKRGDRPALIADVTESGPERILIVGDTLETALVEIRSSQKRPRPTIHRVTKRIRATDSQDATRLEAQRLATEARMLDGTGEKQLRAARGLLTRALALARSLNDQDSVAIDLSAIASIDYQLTDYVAVIAGSTEALAIASERGLRWTETDCLNNIGVAHWQLGDQRKFREDYVRALEIARVTGNRRGEIAIRNNLGLSFRETGENQKSREQYSLALPIARALGDLSAEGVIHGNLAAAYQALAESRLAIDAATRADALFRMAGADRQRIRPLLRLAELRLQSGELSAASRAMADTIRLIKVTADRRAQADAAVLTGKIAFAKKDYIAARREANIAVDLYRDLRLRLGEAAALHLTGEILERTADQDGAFAEFNKALGIRKELGARNEEAETLYRLARIEKRRGHLQEARAYVDAALSRIEDLRLLVFGPRYRMSYTASKMDYFTFSVELLLDMHARNPLEGYDVLAFETVERSRARGLLDLLGESRVVRNDREYQPRIQALLESLNTWSARATTLGAAGKNAEAAAARSKAEAALDRYHALESEIRARFPDSSAKALTAAEIRSRVLDRESALFAYFLGPNKSALWILRGGSIRVHMLPGRAVLESAVREYLALVKSANLAEAARLAAAGTRLTNLLLKPGWDAPPARILISAAGTLQLLPFAALPEPGSGKPLLATREIVMTPSASVLAADRNRPRAAPSRSIAIVADPVFDASDVRIPGSQASGAKPAFPRLVFTRREASEVAKVFAAANPLSLLDFAASRRWFQAPSAASDFRYLHIATHSAYQADDLETPALVLSQVDERGGLRDGFVRARDIAQLDLRAHVVTLSACASGSAREVRGEGLAGLAHGFLQAGARSVIVSLWPVEDEPAFEMMVRFYREMQSASKSGPASALRAAQESMRRDARWANPRHWAGWQSIGEWRP